MNQTEIDELRRLHATYHGAHILHPEHPKYNFFRNALPALLDAAEERDALLRIINDSFLSLNNPTSTLAFDGRNLVPHVEEASRYAEILRLDRDAAESIAWVALGRPEGTHDTSNVQRLCEAHGALKAKLAALVEASEPFSYDQACDAVHHARADRHDQRDTCPIVGRLRTALAAAKVQP